MQQPEDGQQPLSEPHSSSGSTEGANNGAAGDSEQQHKVVLYRGLGMVPFRVLVRLKIFQLAGVAALAIPINTFLVEVSTPAQCPCSQGDCSDGAGALQRVAQFQYIRTMDPCCV